MIKQIDTLLWETGKNMLKIAWTTITTLFEAVNIKSELGIALILGTGGTAIIIGIVTLARKNNR